MSARNRRRSSHKVVEEIDTSDAVYNTWGCRHQQVLLLFINLTTAYSQRACMSVAMVAMTTDSAPAPSEAEGGIMRTLLLAPPYSWSKREQGIILSSFFWGYTLLQLPAGMLARRLGPRRLLAASMAINAAVLLLLPHLAQLGGWVMVAACRAVQGLAQACVMPGSITLLGRWAPLAERGRLSGFAYGGQALGTVLGMPLTGFLASSFLGWPGVFRTYGLMAIIVCGVMLRCCADSPAQHRSATAAEVRYIARGIGSAGGHKLAVPWRAMLRSRGLWAIVAAHVGHSFAQIFLYSEVPTYMSKVAGVNIKANGLLTALPFLVMWLSNFFFNWAVDQLVVRRWTSTTTARKIANTVGAVPASAGLAALCLARDLYAVEALLVLICAFKVAGHVGFQVNHIDISPNFAGTMMSISNFMSNGCGSLAPLATSLMLGNDAADAKQWRIPFLFTGALYFISNIVYVAFGTAERAEWNEGTAPARDEETPMVQYKTNGVENKNIREMGNGDGREKYGCVERNGEATGGRGEGASRGEEAKNSM